MQVNDNGDKCTFGYTSYNGLLPGKSRRSRKIVLSMSKTATELKKTVRGNLYVSKTFTCKFPMQDTGTGVSQSRDWIMVPGLENGPGIAIPSHDQYTFCLSYASREM